MKIAIPYEKGQVFSHFGKSEHFKIYEVTDDEILSSDVIDTNGSGHSALADFLKDQHVNLLICGGIGDSAVVALQNVGIQIMGGAIGEADQQIQDFLNGKLHFAASSSCSRGEAEGDGNISACGHWCH